jgi:3-oxoacyl-[acyl-carrier protein] reductase
MSVFDKPFNSDRDAALVTGAGNGIGLAIAQALVGEGVRTIFADLSEEKVAAAIASSTHPELAVLSALGAACRECHQRIGSRAHFERSREPP